MSFHPSLPAKGILDFSLIKDWLGLSSECFFFIFIFYIFKINFIKIEIKNKKSIKIIRKSLDFSFCLIIFEILLAIDDAKIGLKWSTKLKF